MTDYNKARDFWAGLDRAGRTKILEALKHGAELADHDFSALPPQTHAGIVAGMPVEAAAEPEPEGGEGGEETSRGRKKHG